MARLLLVIALLLWPMAGLAGQAPAKLRVAIMPFDTPKDQPAYTQYGVGTMDSLITGLGNVPDFIMIDRARIEHAIKEQAFAQTGLVDPATAAKLGKLLGAQILVSGSIQTFEGQVRIVANFVDAQTGEIKQNQMVTGANIFELQDRLSEAFIKSQNVAITPEQQQRVAMVIRSTGNVEAYEDYLKGRKAYLQFTPAGYEEAVRWYTRATMADPGYALAFAGLAEARNFWGHHKQRLGEAYHTDYQQAYEAAHRAIQLNPNLAEAYRALGRASGYLGRGGRAQAAYKAHQLNPNDAETLYELWFAAGQQNNPDHEHIRLALALNPDLAAARLDRGLALFTQRRHQEALAEFDHALRLNPASDEAHANRGNALYALRRYGDALVSYQETLKLNPRDAVTHSNLARALNALGRPDEALAASQEALRLNPVSTAARNNMGLARAALKQYDQAVQEYREALRVNPNFAEAYANMGDAMLALRWFGDAINAYNAALGLNSSLAGASLGLANALFDDGRMEEAVPALRAALEIAPEQAMLRYRLGTALQRTGKRTEAAQELEQYLKQAPDAANAAAAREQLRELQH